MNRRMATVTIMVSTFAALSAPTAFGQPCTIIYSQDFSSDPDEWNTNNPKNYYSDSETECFLSRQIDATDEAAWTLLPSLVPGYLWRLEFDVQPGAYDWAGNGRLGFHDADMDVESPAGFWLDFNRDDQGYTITLLYNDSNGGAEYSHFGFFEPGTWYHAVVEYDPQAKTLKATVVRRDNAEVCAQTTFSDVGPFNGIDRLAMSTVGDDYAPGATGMSCFDNIVVLQEPLCPGDLDGDGVVGVKDLLELLGNWGACVP